MVQKTERWFPLSAQVERYSVGKDSGKMCGCDGEVLYLYLGGEYTRTLHKKL